MHRCVDHCQPNFVESLQNQLLSEIEGFDLIFIEQIHTIAQFWEIFNLAKNYLSPDGYMLIPDALPHFVSESQISPSSPHFWRGNVWQVFVNSSSHP
jgi:hypothetical protein